MVYFLFSNAYYIGCKQQQKCYKKARIIIRLRAKKTYGVGLTNENIPAGIVKFMCHMKNIKGVVFHGEKCSSSHFVNYFNAAFLLKPHDFDIQTSLMFSAQTLAFLKFYIWESMCLYWTFWFLSLWKSFLHGPVPCGEGIVWQESNLKCWLLNTKS